jgi:hypothetical protein
LKIAGKLFLVFFSFFDLFTWDFFLKNGPLFTTADTDTHTHTHTLNLHQECAVDLSPNAAGAPGLKERRRERGGMGEQARARARGRRGRRGREGKEGER